MRKWIGGAAFAFACLFLLSGAAGATGSYGQIEGELSRPADWRQIVQNSDFPLGEIAPLGEAGGEPLFEQDYGDYPSLDGSTVAVPMALEFARQHLGLEDADAQGFVFFTTTHSAYEHLIYSLPNTAPQIVSRRAVMEETRPVDLILATEPSREELTLARDQGVTLVMEPVCLDAFVFITHADNPVNSLTLQQIRDIYTGKITNWKEVGGEDLAIEPYQREANSGSQTAMENLVMQGLPLSGATENYVETFMVSLVYRVGEYRNDARALGYTYQYYIEALYPGQAIKVLAIDGIAPTQENLRSGAYPLTTSYYGVFRAGEEEGPGGRFLTWMLSEEGQRCIVQAGYVPVMELSGE